MDEMENKTPKGSNNILNVFGIIEKISDMILNKGLQNFILTFFVGFLTIFFAYFCYNPTAVVKRFEKIQEERHTEAIMKRIQSEPHIREALFELRSDLKADRVFILETHNGGNNLANLPFLYVDMTYAEPKSVLTWLEDEYKNVRLSRYPFATYMFNETLWVGPLEKLMEIDPELYYRLQKEDVKYFGMVMTYGLHTPSGVIGVAYTETEPLNELMIKKILLKYASSISPYLNNEE